MIFRQLNSIKRAPFMVLLITLFIVPSLWAQTPSTSTTLEPEPLEFPQWARDLRRGEIVAFGSFPITYFISNFAYTNLVGGSSFTGNQQKLQVIGAAAATSIIIAIVDHGIVRYKRNRLAREGKNIPEGTPIVIRTPLYEDEAAEPAPPENENP